MRGQRSKVISIRTLLVVPCQLPFPAEGIAKLEFVGRPAIFLPSLFGRLDALLANAMETSVQ